MEIDCGLDTTGNTAEAFSVGVAVDVDVLPLFLMFSILYGDFAFYHVGVSYFDDEHIMTE